MGGISDGESSYPKTRLRDCEPSLGDSFFLYGLWKEFSVAQMLSSSLSIHCDRVPWLVQLGAKCYTAFIAPGGYSSEFFPDPRVKCWTCWQQRRALWKMALAHKAFRFPAMSYLKLPDGFSWIFFHKQNQSIGKSLLCEDPTGRSQGNFNPQQTWPLLLIKTEIQCPNSWFGVRNFACQGRVHLRRIWRKLHFVRSSTPKLIHSLKLIFNLKKK